MAISHDFSPAALAAVIEANMAKFWASFGRLPQSDLHDEPDLLWFTTGAPIASLNGVIRAQFASDEIAAKIEAMLAHFKRRNLPMQWWVGPSSGPNDLGKSLEAHGLARRPWGPPGMAVDLRALTENLPRPPGLVIQPVNDEAALRKWIDASGPQAPDDADIRFNIFAGLGISPDAPMRHYAGVLNDETVGTSSLFLGAGVASVQLVGTAPHARRKGIGSAMSLAPLRDARDLGYRIGILASSMMGLSVYRRLGFREYLKWAVYESSW